MKNAIYKHHLLNELSVDKAKELYKIEIDRRSEKKHGCTVSTRALDRGYARVQLSQKDVPPKFLALVSEQNKLEWSKYKSKCRVTVHALAFRAAGNIVPDYGMNEDIMHTCGRGKQGCITQSHLKQGDHQVNMDAQRCVPYSRCTNCKRLSMVCTHNPSCTNKDKKEFDNQKNVKKVVIYYEDGTKDIIRPQ